MQASSPVQLSRRAAIAQPPRVCVLGGGFGGLYTVLALDQQCQRRRQPCEIILVEPRDRFLFTPLLYELLSDELKPWEIAPSYAALLRHTAVRHYPAKAQQITLSRRLVTLDNGETLPYDYLVVATGSEGRPLSIPGLAEYTHPFRTLADAEQLDSRLAALEASPTAPCRVAIVGGGSSGVELACKISDRLGSRGQIHLIERGDSLLKPFPANLRRTAHRALAQRRVAVHLHASVIEITADAVYLATDAPSPSALPTDLVVWAAGTHPTPWLGHEGEALNTIGQQVPHPTLQLPTFPEVFVVGDQAQMPWRRDRPAPQTAQVAYQAAPVVAHNLVALMQQRSLKSFRYVHLGEMMTLGYGEALVWSFGLVLHGRLAGIIRQAVYLQRLPTWGHRWQVAKHRLGCIGRFLRSSLKGD